MIYVKYVFWNTAHLRFNPWNHCPFLRLETMSDNRPSQLIRGPNQKALGAVTNWKLLVSAATRPIVTTMLEAVRAPTQRAWVHALHQEHPESSDLIDVAEKAEVMSAVLRSWTTPRDGMAAGAGAARSDRLTPLSSMPLAEIRVEAQAMGSDIEEMLLRLRGLSPPSWEGFDATESQTQMPLAEIRMEAQEMGFDIEELIARTLARGTTDPAAVTMSTPSATPRRPRVSGPKMATPQGMTAPYCPVCEVPFMLKKHGWDGSSYWGCRRFPQCRCAAPLGAATGVAPPRQSEAAQEMDEAMRRVKQMEADLMEQQQEMEQQEADLMEIRRRQVEIQQELVARSVRAQQQRQEIGAGIEAADEIAARVQEVQVQEQIDAEMVQIDAEMV